MKYKVVKDAAGNTVAGGPNNAHYEPIPPEGGEVVLADSYTLWEDPAVVKQRQIEAIEREITPRMLREAVISGDASELVKRETKIAAIRRKDTP